MALDTSTRWVVTNQHLHSMNIAANAAILAAREHQDGLTMAAVQTTMECYELLLLTWATERGIALGDISNPRWRAPDDDTP